MANMTHLKLLFSFEETSDLEGDNFLDCGSDLTVHEDQMLSSFTKMRRKPWSDTGFLD